MPLRPSSNQPEPPIYIGDVVQGDLIYVSMKVPLALIPETYDDNGHRKVRWVVHQQNVSRGGYYATQANGVVASNDSGTGTLTMNVDGRHLYRSGDIMRRAIAVIPWDTIQGAIVERPRIIGTPPHQTINTKFPRKIPVSFQQ